MKGNRSTEGGHSGPPEGGLETPPAVGDWSVVPLGDVANAKGGFGFSLDRQGKKEGRYPFFKVSDMNLPRNRIHMVEANNWVDEHDLIALKAKTFPRGALIFPKIGATIFTNKKRLLTRDSVVDNNVVAIVISDPARCQSEFLYQWFQTVDLGKLASPGTVPSITSSRLHTTLVPLPPLPEQQKISGVLGLVQRAMEQQERLIEKTAELKKTLLHQLFTQGTRGERQKQTEIGDMPESWELMEFEDFAQLQRGFDLPKSEFRSGPFPVIGATKAIGYHDTFNVKGPGVTVVRSGSSAGKPQFIPNDFWAHNVVLFVKDFHGHNPRFVYYKIQELDLTKYREGVAVPTLNRNSFRAIPVAIPSREEQNEFVQFLDALECKESVHRRKHATLTALFRTLLHQLMTAQLRVHDLDLDRLLARAS